MMPSTIGMAATAVPIVVSPPATRKIVRALMVVTVGTSGAGDQARGRFLTGC
jgi:hypothetical protein